METKTYWQAMNGDGKVYIYTRKPTLVRTTYHQATGTSIVLFPIPLKPLQIAKITVKENGTWSYEIEREEGWYVAKYKDGSRGIKYYKSGVWYYDNDNQYAPNNDLILSISPARIPDECII